MTTATELLVEFRCDTCYQVRHEPITLAGGSAECPFCHANNIVPEATEDRLRTMQDAEIESAQANAQAGMYVDTPMSREEMDRVAREMAAEKVAEPGPDGFVDVGYLSCDRMPRIIAYLIDGFLGILVYAASFFVGHLLSQMELCQTLEVLALESSQFEFRDWICYGGIAGIAQIVYWFVVAAHGQSPGKFCMGIKIVNAQGQPPGFIQGVLLRSWVAGFLINAIPFVGFGNLLAFFWGTPPRALHDYLAGTWVIHRT